MKVLRLSMFLLLFTSVTSVSTASDTLAYCEKATFANCTSALSCEPVDSATVACSCPQVDQDSVTIGGCLPAEDEKIQSRYPGVPGMGVCTSATNKWADCLGVPCVRTDENSPAKCYCRVTTSQQLNSTQYVIGGPESVASTVCQAGTYSSSATVGQVFDATVVLRRGRTRPSPDIAETETFDPAITWVYWP